MTGSVAPATNTAAIALPPSAPVAADAGARRVGAHAGPSGPTNSYHGCDLAAAGAPRRRAARAAGSSGWSASASASEQRLHERERAAPAVERVGAGVRVADRRGSRAPTGSPVGVGEAADAVEQPAHRPDAADRLERAVAEELVRARAAAGTPARSRRDRMSAARSSPSSGRIASVIESVSPSPGTPRYFTKPRSPPSFGSSASATAGRQPVPAREVHEAALVDRLGDVDAVRGQPLGHRRCAARSRRRPRRPASVRAVGERRRRRRPAVDPSPASATVSAGRPSRRCGSSTAARPAPRCAAPTRRWCAARRAPRGPRRRAGARRAPRSCRAWCAAGGEQRVEHVGEVVAQLDHDAGEEAVGLVDLRGAAPLGDERLLGVGVGRERVALEHGDPVAGAAERERRGQATPPRHHDDATAPWSPRPRAHSRRLW